MTFHETVVDFNNKYAASFDKGDLPLPPSKKLVIGKIDYPQSLLYVKILIIDLDRFNSDLR